MPGLRLIRRMPHTAIQVMRAAIRSDGIFWGSGLHRHILDFIDDPNLRQSVQKALNRGEAYHRMRRAISYVNSGKFRVKTEAEQQIWNECSRLIANAIIYYNSLLLSRVYEQKLTAGDLEAIKVLKSTSPVAWRNVNLIGNFDFTTSSTSVDIEVLAAHYENEDFWRRSLQEGEDDGPESSMTPN